ncbi:hypothetical protein N7499_010312 [Penicillium canescens]|nr:hypothetical protein N7499_010312 [Penicillium canescens]
MIDHQGRFNKGFRTSIKIELCEHHAGKRDFYTTGDSIDGYVWITIDHLLGPGMVEVAFRGQSRIVEDWVLLPVSTYRQQNFLELHQPIENDAFNPDRVLKDGFEYKFPFKFIVPNELPIHACRHKEEHCKIDRSHLLLPPTLGRDDEKRPVRLKDSSFDKIRITYSVQAKLLRQHTEENQPNEPLESALMPVRIIPALQEMPPAYTLDHLQICPQSLRPSKIASWQAAKGTFRVCTLEPNPISLLASSYEESKGPVTTVTMEMEFQPTHDEPPPAISRISRKLLAHTTTHAVPFRTSLSGPICKSKQKTETHIVRLGDLKMSSVRWVEQPPANNVGRDTKEWVTRTGDRVKDSQQKRLYTATIDVLICLPNTKTFVPTFDSCLISRSYAVEIFLYYSLSRKSIGSSPISLRVPLQITGPGR